MPKCYLTGIETPLEIAFVLDIGAASRAARDLRTQLAAIERLLAQLGPIDKVEASRTSSGSVQHQRRLVCTTVADALGKAYPGARLFLPWKHFVTRRAYVAPKAAGKTGKAEEISEARFHGAA